MCAAYLRSSEKNNKQQAILEYEYFNSFESLYLYFQLYIKYIKNLKKNYKLLYVICLFNNIVVIIKIII